MVDASSNAPSRLAIAFLLLLLATVTGAVALTIAGKTPADLFGLFFAEPEDGNWIAVAFDGRRVAPKTYLISIKRGQIVSGYDGCNSWAYLEEKASQNAERMIVTDLKDALIMSLRAVIGSCLRNQNLSYSTIGNSRCGESSDAAIFAGVRKLSAMNDVP
jgi:hypothetical protein